MHTHLDCNPSYLQDIITTHQTAKNTETITASVRSWQQQTAWWASCLGTHVLSVCNVKLGEIINRVQIRACTKEDTPMELSTKQPAPAPSPHTTPLWSMIKCKGRSLQPKGTCWDIRYLWWPDSRRDGSEITVEGKTRKEQKHCRISGWPLNVWQGKPCGLLNCISPRLWQCDDVHDDKDNK